MSPTSVRITSAWDAAVPVYRLACGELADRLSIFEEHLPVAAATVRQRLTSAVLVQHTRVLAAHIVARDGL